MADLLFVMLLVALFAVTVGAVAACDRMIGGDDEVSTPTPVVDETDRIAA